MEHFRRVSFEVAAECADDVAQELSVGAAIAREGAELSMRRDLQGSHGGLGGGGASGAGPASVAFAHQVVEVRVLLNVLATTAEQARPPLCEQRPAGATLIGVGMPASGDGVCEQGERASGLYREN
ncbi:hypothetical protein ACWPKO_28595 (plasmid) [Coraliomargarita sp. W4R53]